jgi:hypothetical protein
MTSDRKNDPRSRLNKILSGGEENQDELEQTAASPLARLPRPQTKSGPALGPVSPRPATQSRVGEAQDAPTGPDPRSGWIRFGPAFWTVTGGLSLLVNGVLIAILFMGLRMLGGSQFVADDTAAGLLGGLYTNFEKMDRASIVAVIPVNAEVPLTLSVPVQKTTEITLAQDVTISGARVRINTDALNIDAPAEVTLPAGTRLNVALDFVLDVNSTIPVHLEAPVNIPLAQTELHEPFTGLQDVLRPLYCLVEPNALTLDGLPICR